MCLWQTNRVFKSVCDVFIPVPEPKSEAVPSQDDSNREAQDIILLTRNTLKLIFQDTKFSKRLSQRRIPVCLIPEFLRNHIDQFEHKRKAVGYKKFTPFLRECLLETGLALSERQ